MVLNNALAMTSIGCKTDETVNEGEEAVNDGISPYVFKLHGELSHRSGSLLPPEGESPVYAQLYIYDPADAANFWMANRWNTHLNHHTLITLQDMLYCCHPAVQLYKQAHELTRNLPPEQQCKIALCFDQGCDHRRYNLPDATNNEITVILPGDGDQLESMHDIVLFHRHGPPLQRITNLHPLYPALRYILMFPTGQLQWHPWIEYAAADIINQDDGANSPRRHKYVSKSDFYCYCLHPQPPAV
jgi:hypothetical protein